MYNLKLKNDNSKSKPIGIQSFLISFLIGTVLLINAGETQKIYHIIGDPVYEYTHRVAL